MSSHATSGGGLEGGSGTNQAGPGEKGRIRVVISAHLREYTAGRNEIEMDGVDSVRALIGMLDSQFPGISFRLLDDQGNVRRYVNIFADSMDIRELNGVHTSLSGVKEVVILPSVAGG